MLRVSSQNITPEQFNLLVQREIALEQEVKNIETQLSDKISVEKQEMEREDIIASTVKTLENSVVTSCAKLSIPWTGDIESVKASCSAMRKTTQDKVALAEVRRHDDDGDYQDTLSAIRERLETIEMKISTSKKTMDNLEIRIKQQESEWRTQRDFMTEEVCVLVVVCMTNRVENCNKK